MKHKEAFCLMTYHCSNCGHRERIWNSRDGVTPFIVDCPKCNSQSGMQHINFKQDEYAPNHKLSSGERYFASMTKDQAHDLAKKRVRAHFKPGEKSDEYLNNMIRNLSEEYYHEGNSPILLTFQETFQEQIRPWLVECFGLTIATDRVERNHRFLEEALELVQACDCTKEEAHLLVEYVFNRPKGEIFQEAGGVMITLACLCLAQGISMHDAGDTELSRVWTKVEQIREKQKSKPKL